MSDAATPIAEYPAGTNELELTAAKVGMAAFLCSEAAFFGTLLVAYLTYLGKLHVLLGLCRRLSPRQRGLDSRRSGIRSDCRSATFGRWTLLAASGLGRFDRRVAVRVAS